jgi:hypothetical protein
MMSSSVALEEFEAELLDWSSLFRTIKFGTVLSNERVYPREFEEQLLDVVKDRRDDSARRTKVRALIYMF